MPNSNFIELLLQMKFNIIKEDNYLENDIEFKETFYETKEKFNLQSLAEIFLFLECYKGEIIKSKIIKTEVSDRNPGYKKNVNEIFYILMESFLKSIYINKEVIHSMEIYRFIYIF